MPNQIPNLPLKQNHALWCISLHTCKVVVRGTGHMMANFRFLWEFAWTRLPNRPCTFIPLRRLDVTTLQTYNVSNFHSNILQNTFSHLYTSWPLNSLASWQKKVKEIMYLQCVMSAHHGLLFLQCNWPTVQPPTLSKLRWLCGRLAHVQLSLRREPLS